MENKYIFLDKEYSKGMNLNDYILSDLFKNGVQHLEIKKKELKNPILKFIRRAHLSYRISKIITLPMKSIWSEFPTIDIDENCNYYIIIPIAVFFDCNISAIKRRYKKHKNVKFIFFLFDSIDLKFLSNKLARALYKNKLWNYVLTYDMNDAEKYNLVYLDEHYYSMPEIEEEAKIDKDAYFIGGLKPGRTKETVELFAYLKNRNVNVKFDVVNSEELAFDYKSDGFNILKKSNPYSYALKETNNANCIIEFLQTGQKAQSLRYFEAVCLNKKLLTNNENVKKLSFYNEKYMKVFNKLEDIDTEWVKSKEEVNYNYNNEFSPIHIIEKIEELEQK